MADFNWNDICKNYPSNLRKFILDNVSFSINSGECVLINGRNGSGKSTLLKIMSGLIISNSGEFVLSDGQSYSLNYKHKILHQLCLFTHAKPYLFAGTVKFNLNLCFKNEWKLNNENIILNASRMFNLESYLNTNVDVLSEGERQRVSLARSWLNQSKIFFLDEINSNLDDWSRTQNIDFITKLKRKNIAIVIVSHNNSEFTEIVDRIMLLEGGKLVTIKAG